MSDKPGISVTGPVTAPTAASLVLSLFPGIDLLGRGFEAEGFCVVRGPDLIFGGDIREFHTSSGHFAGVIGGPPCQQFSTINRNRRPELGKAMLDEYCRVVTEAMPLWWLMENVPSAPSVEIQGYRTQRFNLNASECGSKQNRNRSFQFGYRDGKPLVIPRDGPAHGSERCCLASEGRKTTRRTWQIFCQLQGLPDGFDLPDFHKAAKYRAVGNGVPIPMGRVIAGSVLRRPVTPVRLCLCQCGREVAAGRTMATVACRKRMQRERDRSIAGRPQTVTVTGPGLFGSGLSLAGIP